MNLMRQLFCVLFLAMLLEGTALSQVGTLLMTDNTMFFGDGKLFLYDIKTGQTDTLYRGKARGACFSPDGFNVAFSEDNHPIKIINLFTRKMDSIGFVLPKSQILWWAADNCIYFPPKWGKVLLKINVATQKVDTVYNLQCTYVPAQATDNAGFFTGNVSVDGTRGAYTIDNDQRGNRAVSIVFATKTEKTISDQNRLSCQSSISPAGKYVVCANYNHTSFVVKKFGNDSTYRLCSGVPNVFMTQFSYNSDDVLVCRDVNEYSSYLYQISTSKLTRLLRGPCAWTIDVRGWILDTVPALPPNNLMAVHVQDKLVRLAWVEPAPASDGHLPVGYIIERNGMVIGTTEALTYVDRTASPLTSYTYKVYSRDPGVSLSSAASLEVSTTGDVYPPKIVAAYSVQDSTKIRLVFSEPVDSASAVVAAHYSVQPGVSITKAAMLTSNEVLLTTGAFTTLSDYWVKTSDIGDKNASMNLTTTSDSFPLFVLRSTVLSSGRKPTWSLVMPDSSNSPDDAAWEKFPSFIEPKYLRMDYLKAWWADLSYSAESVYVRFAVNRPATIYAVGCAGRQYSTWLSNWTNLYDFIGSLSVFSKEIQAGTFSANGTGFPKGVDKSSNLFLVRALDDSIVTGGTLPATAQERRPDVKKHGGLELACSPNPFNPTLNIRINGVVSNAELKILNISGRVVARLGQGLHMVKEDERGHQVFWNASGHASGVYFVVLKSGLAVQQKKVFLVR